LDENKKPGGPAGRDISDLKARLGLKKTGVMPAVSPTGQPVAPAPGQPAAQAPVPPPPGTPAAAIPAPFAQPATQQPAAAPAPQPPPDPKRDPFAQQQAANLAAFYGIGQVLPGSAEGVSAEPISKPKPWGRIGVYALAGVVVFGVGGACGAVYKSRVEFNRTIDQAAGIRAEVDKIAKQVNAINDLINASAPSKTGAPDFELAKKLGELDLKKPDTTKLFKTNYAQLEDVAVERLMTYYNDTIKLFDMVTLHAKKTEADKEAIENYQKTAGKGEKNFGVIISAAGAIPVAQLVEMGTPVCQDKEKTDCPANQLAGFKYRTDSGASWSERPVKGKLGETVTPIQQNAFFKSVISGNPDILAFKDYVRRLGEIKTSAMSVLGQQKDVVGDLKRAAERPKVFTF
jgi:hypothetical protein